MKPISPSADLPIRRDLTLPYRLSLAVAALMVVASVAGDRTGEIMDRNLRVRAEGLSDEDAEDLWPSILRHAPTYARYRKSAGRSIPLVRLVPVGPGQGRDCHEEN